MMILEKIKKAYNKTDRFINIIGDFIYKYRFIIAILI